MKKEWHEKAWADYLFWQIQDKKTIKKINNLIRDLERSGDKGIGHQEHLRGDLSGWSSVRIDQKNRLIYQIKGDVIQILSCRGHYSDK